MRVFSASIPAVAGLLLAATTAPALAAGATERVSLGRGGVQARGGASFGESISANGRVVAFLSNATNLVPGDTNGEGDVFVRDRRPAGSSGPTSAPTAPRRTAASGSAGVSADGHLVAFDSLASNLVAGDTNQAFDVFVSDWRGARPNGSASPPTAPRVIARASTRRPRPMGASSRSSRRRPTWCRATPTASTTCSSATRRPERRSLSASVPAAPGERRSGDGRVAISADGRFVAFNSSATNLVPGDKNGRYDLFVRDRKTGTTVRASVRSDGSEDERGQRASRPSRGPGASSPSSQTARTSCPATRTRRTTSSSTT